MDRNISIGSSIAVFGLTLSLGAYILLGNIPLTAMGIGLIIIGVSWALIPQNPIPRKAIMDIVKSSCSNIEAFLEFVGATRRAIYIPSKEGGRVMAYVPLKGSIPLNAIANNDDRMIVRHGEGLGVMITPPKVEFGNPSVEYGGSVEAILNYVLIEASEIAESINVVKSEDGFIIEIRNVRVDIEYPRFKVVMGSLPSCLAAQAIATTLSKPVQIVDEKRDGDRLIVQLRLMDWIETTYT
jgi:hypothetical protein